MSFRLPPVGALAPAAALAARAAEAGVVNPDISVLGQSFVRWVFFALTRSGMLRR